MIPIYQEDAAVTWLAESCEPARCLINSSEVQGSVSSTINVVRDEGDNGVRRLCKQFGDNVADSLKLTGDEIEQALNRLAPEIKDIISTAADNIKQFAQAVMQTIHPVQVSQAEFSTGLDFRPVQRVACYVPAGRYALPSTALMTALSAQAAGVAEICIACPRPADEVIYAGTLAGVSEFYRLGGAQAVAALAFGTESVKAVDMIVGPGNVYVTEAKRQLQGVVGIDMLAGPSEVAIIADGTTSAYWVALDMLSQAEHDPNARAYLFCTQGKFARQVQAEIQTQVEKLKLPPFIEQSLEQSAIVILGSIELCVEAANSIAPEHLQLHVQKPQILKERLKNYGALFMGAYATVPYGDYMAGPNHTLPTNRSARFTGGLNPLTFLRAQSWIDVLPGAQRLSSQTESFATLEGLTAHAAAAIARLS